MTNDQNNSFQIRLPLFMFFLESVSTIFFCFQKYINFIKLNDESKRIGYNNTRSNVQTRRIYNEDLINKFIETQDDNKNTEINKLFDIITWKSDAFGVVLVSEDIYKLTLSGNDDIVY